MTKKQERDCAVGAIVSSIAFGLAFGFWVAVGVFGLLVVMGSWVAEVSNQEEKP